MRGTGDVAVQHRPRDRITPACAGNSGAYLDPEEICEDHPRVCGEQCGVFFTLENGVGSPPRVRGTDQSPFR